LKMQAIDADRALQDYKIANNLMSTGKGLLGAEQLSNLSTQLANARIAVAEAKVRLNRIQQMGPTTILSLAAADTASNPSHSRTNVLNHALSNAELVKLRSQYRELATKVAEIASLVGPQHLAVVKLRERMEELSKLIREEELRIADS